MTCLNSNAATRPQQLQKTITMFRNRNSERGGLCVDLRAPIVPILLILCLIAPGLVYSEEAPEKERERRILEIQQLFGQGDLAAARKLLDEALKRFPADAGLDNLQGIIDASEGNYAAAERSFR